MHILALAPRTPFPADRRDRIRCYHLLSRLGKKHRISLLSVDNTAADVVVHETLASFCRRHYVAAMSPLRRMTGAAGSLLAAEPLSLGYFHQPALDLKLMEWTAKHRFDVAYVLGSSMAPYWLRERRRSGLPAVLDFIDLDSTKCERYARSSHLPRRWIYRRERRFLGRYEAELATRAQVSLLASQSDVARLEAVAPGAKVRKLENGVDGGFFARGELVRRADPPRVVIVGQMDSQANVDAVLWFADEVFPRLRERHGELRLDIVGARPGRRIQALARRAGIRVTGWVADVRPYLWEGSVCVAPLRMALGTPMSVLEAMAASLPVVASPMAARGLSVPEGDHLRVAESAEAFVTEILDLIDDPQRAVSQAEAALSALSVHHSWESAAAQLEAHLETAAACREGSAVDVERQRTLR